MDRIVEVLAGRTLTIGGEEVTVGVAYYARGGAPVVQLVSEDGEPYATVTVNAAGADLGDGEILVATWSEHAHVADAMLATGWFEDTGRRVACGFAEAHVWRVREPAIECACPHCGGFAVVATIPTCTRVRIFESNGNVSKTEHSGDATDERCSDCGAPYLAAEWERVQCPSCFVTGTDPACETCNGRGTAPRPVRIGERRRFVSTLKGEDEHGQTLRLYTGQLVNVEAECVQPEEEGERLFSVRASDGATFNAWERELNGQTAFFYEPSGTLVSGSTARLAAAAQW